jgi:2-polyprenyl-3-methyl-5-hydroxy-6-metoxy-1,4-benzoquinol methylase
MCNEDILILKNDRDHINLRMADKITDNREIINSSCDKNAATGKFSKTHLVLKKETLKAFYANNPRIFNSYFKTTMDKAVILDLGCGESFGMENWIKGCGEYHGVDLSLESLGRARKYLPKKEFPNTNFYCDEVKSDYFPDNFADFIICSEVIEHLDDPHGVVNYCHDKLNPGGILSISTPCSSCYFYPSYLLPSLVVAPVRWYKLINAHKYWEEALKWHPGLRPSQFKKMVSAGNFEILEHFSCIWYYASPARTSMRISSLLEKMGLTVHLKYYKKYIEMMESICDNKLPLLKFIGTRQFIVARKR